MLARFIKCKGSAKIVKLYDSWRTLLGDAQFLTFRRHDLRRVSELQADAQLFQSGRHLLALDRRERRQWRAR